MDKKELINAFKLLQKFTDIERAHIEADELLLEYIGDEDIANEYNEIEKWYA